MNRALGLIEVIGLTNAIIVADTMLKAANIQMENIEITKGMGFVTVKISGDVGAVNAAIDSGKSLAVSFDKFVSSKVIPRPAKGLDSIFDLDRDLRDEIKSKSLIKGNKKIEEKEIKKIEPKVVKNEIKHNNVGTKETKAETKTLEKEKTSVKERNIKTNVDKSKANKAQTTNKNEENPKISE